MLLGGPGVTEDRSGVRRPGLTVSAYHLCVLGEIAASSEPVFHLFGGNLLLRCMVRKKGDSLTCTGWKVPSTSQSYCIHLPSQPFPVLRIFTEMISCYFLVLRTVATCLPMGSERVCVLGFSRGKFYNLSPKAAWRQNPLFPGEYQLMFFPSFSGLGVAHPHARGSSVSLKAY